MSVAMWNCHSWPLDVSSNMKLTFLTTRCQYPCRIAIQHVGAPSAKVGLSAKLCVPVFKASLLDYWGVHLTKCVCLPSAVYWHSRHLCCIQGGPLDKVGSSAQCCVLVFWGSFRGVVGCWGGLHLTWLYHANWLFTTLIIQNKRKFPPFLKESKMAAKYIP